MTSVQANVIKIFARHVLFCKKDPLHGIEVHWDGESPKAHFRITGLSGKNGIFEGAEYIILITALIGTSAQNSFPFCPPKFEFLTPNGIFQVGSAPCISIGMYHKDNYDQTLGLRGFVLQLVSNLDEDFSYFDEGVGIIDTRQGSAIETIKKYSIESVNWNRLNYPTLMMEFDKMKTHDVPETSRTANSRSQTR
jgi:ubiquitin-protein ligase